MSQTKQRSLKEAVSNTLVGMSVNYVANFAILPFFGFAMTFGKSLGITACFTVVSIVRNYVVRRWFNKGDSQ